MNQSGSGALIPVFRRSHSLQLAIVCYILFVYYLPLSPRAKRLLCVLASTHTAFVCGCHRKLIDEGISLDVVPVRTRREEGAWL